MGRKAKKQAEIPKEEVYNQESAGKTDLGNNPREKKKTKPPQNESTEKNSNQEYSQYGNTPNYFTPSTYGNDLYYDRSYTPCFGTPGYGYDSAYAPPTSEYAYPAQPPSEYGYQSRPSQFYHQDVENIYFEDSTTKGDGRGPVNLKFIEGKTRRGVTFSKRKKGLMKKAYEISVLTGSEVLVLVASEGGNVYSFATDRFKKMIDEHQPLIKECLSNPSYAIEGKENRIETDYESADGEDEK